MKRALWGLISLALLLAGCGSNSGGGGTTTPNVPFTATPSGTSLQIQIGPLNFNAAMVAVTASDTTTGALPQVVQASAAGLTVLTVQVPGVLTSTGDNFSVRVSAYDAGGTLITQNAQAFAGTSNNNNNNGGTPPSLPFTASVNGTAITVVIGPLTFVPASIKVTATDTTINGTPQTQTTTSTSSALTSVITVTVPSVLTASGDSYSVTAIAYNAGGTVVTQNTQTFTGNGNNNCADPTNPGCVPPPPF